MRDGPATMPADERARQELALLVEQVSDYAIFLLDPDGHVLTWNVGAQRAKGWTAEEIVGRHFSAFYTDEDRARGRPQAMLDAARRNGRQEDVGWRVRKDGERFWASVVITAIRDEDGELLGFGKVTRDLSDQREAQQDLELFASTAAHDLRDPARTIAGLAELLERRHGEQLSAEGRELVAHIAGSARRMQLLIDGLLSYARSGGQAAAAEPVALAAALEAVLAALGAALAERGLAPVVRVAPEALVLADRPAVELALGNLLSNAIKFADPERPEVGVDARQEDDEWVVSVTDNGPGIPPDKRRMVFEPFVRLEGAGRSGSGLGLAIARRAVGRHGGRVGVEPAAGGGSRFYFALRRAAG